MNAKLLGCADDFIILIGKKCTLQTYTILTCQFYISKVREKPTYLL